MIKTFFLSILALFSFWIFTSDHQPHISELLEGDQEYLYEVRYGFMRLGNVTLTAHRDTVFNGKEAFYYRTEITSNPSLPFVGYKEVHYHSIFALNDSIPYGLKFWSDRVHRDIEREYEYIFDYDKGLVFSFQQGQPLDTLTIVRPGDSGPAFYHYSRIHAGTGRSVSYPIYINDSVGFVEIDYNADSSRERWRAANQNIYVYTASGNADFEGPFGFSGEFTASFKADPCRTPLEASVNVWVGSVRVLLQEVRNKCIEN